MSITSSRRPTTSLVKASINLSRVQNRKFLHLADHTYMDGITHGDDGRVWGWITSLLSRLVHSVHNPQESFLHALTFVTLCTGQAYCLLGTSCLRHLNSDEQQGKQLPLLSRLCVLYTVAGTRQVSQTQHNRRLVPPHLQHLAKHSCQLSCPHRHPHWVYCYD